jgi:hypothetical protein
LLLVEENTVTLMAILERARTLGQLEEVGAAMAEGQCQLWPSG